ncbi:MAG: ribosome recycling factor [Patescibacteria group bacterium]|nr:ribosome recycling factor [Patescibacteria group bacterium]
MYNFNELNTRIKEATDYFLQDLKSIQTGRATPMVLDNVLVVAYGSLMNISHLASVSIEDAKTLRISPFDKSVSKDMEKAINDANLGLSVASDGEGLRVIFPSLTTERRQQYVRLAKDKLEDVRIKIRAAREDSKRDIEQKGKNGEFGEDDRKRMLEDLQDKIDQANSLCEGYFTKKEEEILKQ